jgi:chemotaxis protein methyltransferase CheR
LTGLAFYNDRDEVLAKLIAGRLSNLGLPNCASYSRFLTDKTGAAEMEVLISKLTIGETYFFRDEEQFTALRDLVLPDILRRNRSTRQLRIWSAGCATGAEPYSLAILLMREMACEIAGWQVEIHGTDLNQTYLARAAAGEFRAWALRSTPDAVKRECFRKQGLVWTIHPQFKRWVSFHQMNLVESRLSMPFSMGQHFDLILCRNVMIYFKPEVSRRLIGHFHQALNEEGWLVVGATEHNLVDQSSFSPVRTAGAKVYQKTAAPVAKAGMAREQESAHTPIAEAEPRLPDMDALRLLADRGDWENAAEYSRKLLKEDKLNPETHFYQALILQNIGIADEPERSLRQAIYLDRNFAIAHYHLGLTLKRDGQTLAAARSFGNVLKVLVGVHDESNMAAAPGVTAVGLRGLAQMQLVNMDKT